MDWWVWIVTGFVAGSLARRFMRSRGYGLTGDLILGWIGGLAGGWLFRLIGFGASANPLQHATVSLIGAMLVLGVSRWVRPVARETGKRIAGSAAVLDLESQIRRLGRLEAKALSALLSRRPAADPNRMFDEQLTFGQRVADRVARFGGSWTFIGLFLLMMLAWMSLNTETRARFDPYPFILLNLVLSCLAALQAPIIMMSQNRQAARDRIDAQHDYEVNLRSELEIQHLHAKLDDHREREFTGLLEIQQRQLDLLETIVTRLDTRTAGG